MPIYSMEICCKTIELLLFELLTGMMGCVNTVTTTEESNIVTSDQSVSLSDTHNTAAEIDVDLQIKVSDYASCHTPESNIFIVVLFISLVILISFYHEPLCTSGNIAVIL